MSLIYSVLKPLLRLAGAKKSAMTREDFIQQAEKMQNRQYKLPDIRGYEKQEQMIAGCRCIIYAKRNSAHQKAIVYYAAASKKTPHRACRSGRCSRNLRCAEAHT